MTEVGAAVDAGGTSAAAPPPIIPEPMAADVVAMWAELLNVHKSKTANAGTYSYTYGDLGDLLAMARPILARHNLALIQPLTRQAGEPVTIHTMLVHTSGHCMWWPFDVASGQTAQQTGSGVTYGRRYCAGGALGVAFEDDDDDGKAAATPVVESFEDAVPAPSVEQTKLVSELFNKLDVVLQKERRELMSAILDRPVQSWPQTSPDERLQIIAELRERIKRLDEARDHVGRLPDV